MILDPCFEVTKLEDPILNFQILFDKRNMELKISQHARGTCLWFVTIKVADLILNLIIKKDFSILGWSNN